ncbi:MAG: SMC-Scp complex subunit ScpB [Candidatus Omnitrophota bacterium]|nr:SMC-Scp complex subunit ScpB [Candidatus Omnitrophota bacterium]
MDKSEAKRIIEAVLFVSDKPVSIATLKEVLRDIEPTEIRSCMEELNSEYNSSGRSFSIKEIAGGFQMLTDPVYSTWISSLYKKPADRMTGPALETLAIIAYKQPLTRSDIEAIRGVNVDGVLHTLEERSLIKTRGRVDGPGRPILYGTTNEFLQHFGLKSLEDLPKLKEFQESDLDFVKEERRSQVIVVKTGELSTIDKPAESRVLVSNEPAKETINESKET